MPTNPNLTTALGAAIRPACDLAKHHPAELLAAISAFLPVTLENVPPNRLETALRSIETHTDNLPSETIEANKAFCSWVRAEMKNHRIHGFG